MYICIYVYMYMNKKPVYVLHSDKKSKKHKVCLTNFRIFLILKVMSYTHYI